MANKFPVQTLKEQLEKDLKGKLEYVDQLLTELKLSMEDVEANCAKSKYNLQKSAEEMIQEINLRKMDLMKDLDNRAQVQSNIIQERMELAFLTMGSLQSMLRNVASFDDKQLLNLQVPITTRLQKELQLDAKVPPQNYATEKLREEIAHWGRVEGSCVLQEHHLNLVESDDKIINKLNDFQIKDHTEEWKVDDSWSDDRSTKTSNADDFEMLAMDINLDEEEKENDISFPTSSSEAPVVPDVDDNKLEMTPVALPNYTEISNDLSIWLKPKKQIITKTPEEVPTVPPEMFQPPRSLTSSNVSSRSSLLDFPGLRLDPKCWLQKKKNDRFKLSEELLMNWCQKEIIPPTYTLPYPFWLKKC